MTCKEGAKVYCRNSWQNGGYASESECLEDVTLHQCPSFMDKLTSFVKRPFVWGSALVLAATFIIYKFSK